MSYNLDEKIDEQEETDDEYFNYFQSIYYLIIQIKSYYVKNQSKVFLLRTIIQIHNKYSKTKEQHLC